MKVWKAIILALWEVKKMHKLLSAGFARLKKDYVFWICMVTMLVMTIYHVMSKSEEAIILIEKGTMHYLDNYYFDMGPFIGVFCAIFICLFIGTEYSDGVIRNKLIVGHTRTQVYISNFIISIVACECFVMMWVIGGLVAIPKLGFWQIGYDGFALYVLLSLLYTAALTGIFVLVSMLSFNKAVNAVLEILLALILILIGSAIFMQLREPAETTARMVGNVIVDSGGVPMPNSDYVGGTLRGIFQFLADSLPTSQALLMRVGEISRPVLSATASIVITVVTLIFGSIAFNKKDLK